MTHTCIRWTLFIGLAAFVPLLYYLAVVGGWLPYGGILLITIRNISDWSIVSFGLFHLVPYGVLLYWVAGVVTKFIERRASGHAWLATTAVLLLLAGIGALPIFGIAHGHIRWLNAYELYASHALR